MVFTFSSYLATRSLATPGDALAIEVTGYQSAFVQEALRTTDLPLRAVRPSADKLTRAAGLIRRFEQHMVWIDDSVPHEFIKEWLSFGSETGHDDQCKWSIGDLNPPPILREIAVAVQKVAHNAAHFWKKS